MILALVSLAVLVIALGVIRAAAKARVDDLRLDLAEAWTDIDDARDVRRALVGELVPLLGGLSDLEPRERRVVDDLRREHLAAARPVTAAGAGRVEQRLMAATSAALDLAGRRTGLAEAALALRAELDDAGTDLRDVAERYNEVVAEIEGVLSSFAGSLVGDDTDRTAVRLGHELGAGRQGPVRSG